MAKQQFECFEIAAGAGNVRRDTIRRVGSRLEQHLRKRQVSDGADRTPQCRPRKLGVPVPVVLGVGIRAERAETASDVDESLETGRDTLVHGRVAHVEQRLPVLRPAWLQRELRMIPAADPPPPQRRRGRERSAA